MMKKENDMEKVFFELYENQSCMAVEVGHNSIAGWCINIYDVKGKKLGETHDAAISIEESLMELAFAKAYIGLCEYLLEVRGGY